MALTKPADAPGGAEILSLSGVSKSFPGVRALDGVRLDLRAGEVMALIGENGAGKSTLVKILTGIEAPDAGTILMDGTPVAFASPHDAWLAGITAIHQETVMFDELTVAENIHMGHHPRRRGLFRRFIDWRGIRTRTRDLLDRLDVAIDPDAVLRDLSVAQKHIVGIAKALSHDARIVIMDEPTAALSQREIEELYQIVRQLKAAGKAILFISHKFEEIFAIADRWTVLRDGRWIGSSAIGIGSSAIGIGSGATGAVTRGQLVAMMVGRALDQVFPKRAVPIGETVLEVEDLSHPTEFDGISFRLRRGEILGFYGLVGAGRSEVMQALFGITRPSRGRITVRGRPVAIDDPRAAIRAGIAYVPEDRQLQGAVPAMSITGNITLPMLERINGGLLLHPARERATAAKYRDRLSIRAASLDQPVGTLSGGNQQKVLIAKWLATDPAIIILDEPTKGIDVGSKAAVHDFMGELAEAGLAVILVSSELPEILGMADSVIVMHEGRIRRRFTRAETTAEAIVTAATGNA